MQFDLNIEEVSTSRCRLIFSVSSKEVKKELDNTYAQFQKEAICGLRKGKVPRWLLEKRLSDRVNADVANNCYNKLMRAPMFHMYLSVAQRLKNLRNQEEPSLSLPLGYSSQYRR